jgi:rhodanese-related sulfurtransferase
MKKKSLFLMLIYLIICLFAAGISIAETTLPLKKQTVLGKYINAKKAYEMYVASPDTIKILDVRTIGEYIFVGHAPMATNIPFMFLKPGIMATNKPFMPMNKNFIHEVEQKYKKDDIIFAICRSGGRSAAAVNILAKAGFTNIYTIVDGFEGDKDKQGRRTVNGWINSKIPWTYRLNPKHVYSPI